MVQGDPPTDEESEMYYTQAQTEHRHHQYMIESARRIYGFKQNIDKMQSLDIDIQQCDTTYQVYFEYF